MASFLNLVLIPKHRPPCNCRSQLQLRAGDTENRDRRESGGGNREAALDRTHGKGSKLQMPTLSIPNSGTDGKMPPSPAPGLGNSRNIPSLRDFSVET